MDVFPLSVVKLASVSPLTPTDRERRLPQLKAAGRVDLHGSIFPPHNATGSPQNDIMRRSEQGEVHCGRVCCLRSELKWCQTPRRAFQ